MNQGQVLPLSGAAGSGSLAALHVEARTLVRSGLVVFALGIVPASAWLALAPLASAVLAPGFVKVDLNRRPVQHAEGGIVSEVRVRDGQRVSAGEPLIVLGDVSVEADLNRLGYRVNAEQAGLARLEAEQAGLDTIDFPAALRLAAADDQRLAEQLAKERALFAARRDALTGHAHLLGTQRDKVVQEIDALRSQVERAGASIGHQKDELEMNRRLSSDGFISATRVSQLEAAVADYAVKLEERRSELARAEQRRVEIELKSRSLYSDYRQQASDQLKVTASRLSEIQQELRKSRDAAARQVIVAPTAGDVIGLRITAPGAVVAPRETIADIVPADVRLVIEARIRTEDIDRVAPGQEADIRFTAFKSRSTRLVAGRVIYVSSDRFTDRDTDSAYYTTLIEADPRSLHGAGGIKLVAGMPAEVYLKGETRTPLQYLAEPVSQVLRRAARER
jgi:epimerase transport system membrane fusion protein